MSRSKNIYQHMALLRAALLCLCLVMVAGCASTPPPSPSIRLDLDGPKLVLVGELEGRSYDGYMDRHGMAGVGTLSLYEQGTQTTCQGSMDSPASEKGRLYAQLACSDGRTLHVVLRNLGPDQGMGIGRLEGQSARMTLFYHPCLEDAQRRLKELRHELDALEAAAKGGSIKEDGGPKVPEK